jgi:hypothetical protein
LRPPLFLEVFVVKNQIIAYAAPPSRPEDLNAIDALPGGPSILILFGLAAVASVVALGVVFSKSTK